MEDERKQRATAVNGRNKLLGDMQGMEQHLAMATKVKEDAVKQYKKIAAQLKDFQRELDDSRISRDDAVANARDTEKKVSVGSSGSLLSTAIRCRR